MIMITYTINCYDKGCANKVESEGFSDEAQICNSCKLDFFAKHPQNHANIISREDYDEFVDKYGNKKQRDDNFLSDCIDDFERNMIKDDKTKMATCLDCGMIFEVHKISKSTLCDDCEKSSNESKIQELANIISDISNEDRAIKLKLIEHGLPGYLAEYFVEKLVLLCREPRLA